MSNNRIDAEVTQHVWDHMREHMWAAARRNLAGLSQARMASISVKIVRPEVGTINTDLLLHQCIHRRTRGAA